MDQIGQLRDRLTRQGEHLRQVLTEIPLIHDDHDREKLNKLATEIKTGITETMAHLLELRPMTISRMVIVSPRLNGPSCEIYCSSCKKMFSGELKVRCIISCPHCGRAEASENIEAEYRLRMGTTK